MDGVASSPAISAPTVKTVPMSAATRAIDVIVLAFSSDPVARWTWSDPHQFLLHFPRFVQAFGGEAFSHDSAYGVDDYSGAALWLPPGVEPDEQTLMTLLQQTSSEQSRRDAPEVMQQMGRFHPSEPHWYLPLMGIDPLRQGQGRGSALIRHALVPVDTDRRPAYLESTNPKNVPLYQRHGFELLGTVQVGSSPPIFPMLRPARSQ
jgi:GNAT superfamily N-acetyltransferase